MKILDTFISSFSISFCSSLFLSFLFFSLSRFLSPSHMALIGPDASGDAKIAV